MKLSAVLTTIFVAFFAFFTGLSNSWGSIIETITVSDPSHLIIKFEIENNNINMCHLVFEHEGNRMVYPSVSLACFNESEGFVLRKRSTKRGDIFSNDFSELVEELTDLNFKHIGQYSNRNFHNTYVFIRK